MKSLILALIMVESGGDPSAFNKSEDAAGVLQIRPIMVAECNRLAGHGEWSEDDRWDRQRSIQMALWFFAHCRNKPESMSLEEYLARCWNCGHATLTPARIKATDQYWLKVRHQLRIIETKVDSP